MEEENKVEETETSEEQKGSEPSQEIDPIQEELQRVERKPKRSRLETLKYNRDRLDTEYQAELKKAGVIEDDNRPLTVGEFRSMQQQTAQETALTLADAIENEPERKLVRYHLENTIKPSGDAETDLRNARLIVNSVKNGQVVEETLRAIKPKTAASAPSAPPREKQKDDITAEEKQIMSAFKLTEEQVLAARPKE